MTISLASEASFREIADQILKASSAENTFVSFGDSDSTTLRFANNQVTQHVSVRGPSVSVHVANGQKAGSASTNRLDKKSILETVKRAEAIAKFAPDDPEYLPPLPPQKYLKVPSFRSMTAEATPMSLADRVKPILNRSAQESLNSAGVISNSASASGVAASTGLFAFEKSTEAEYSLTAAGDDSSGWVLNSHRDINELLVDKRSAKAIEKAVRSKEPREIPAGRYPVIFEPAAMAGVFGSFLWGLSAKSYYKGDSALKNKLGSAVLDSRLTLRTDPTHPDLMCSAFGGDGMATKPETWVENGVLKQLYYDRFTAKEHNVEPNPWPSTPILTFSGPTVRTIEELIADTEQAILVTNFWYIRSVDPADMTITGMTRDGTFLIENGKIVAGVRNFRFHDSPLRCFSQVDKATGPMEAITLESGKMLLPTVRLPDFNFSSVTKF